MGFKTNLKKLLDTNTATEHNKEYQNTAEPNDMMNLIAEQKTNTATQAETALEFVCQLFEEGAMCDRFNEIADADPELTSSDLCYIVFLDSSSITIDPGTKTVKIA